MAVLQTEPQCAGGIVTPTVHDPRMAEPAVPSGTDELTAVDNEGLSGDPTRLIRREEEHHFGDLTGLAQSAEGDGSQRGLIEFGVRGFPFLPGSARKLDRT